MRQKRYNFSRQFGFTLVEILVAASIFSVFSVGVFSFYRMGSNMFVKGSWKLRKQKEAERFLSRLKERVEQASNAVSIDPSQPSNAQLITSKADFITIKNGNPIGTGTSPIEPSGATRLMLFSICKPDLSKLGQKKGLRLFNSLVLVQSKVTSGAKKLYTLYFASSKNSTAINGIDFFNSSTSYAPALPPGSDFSATPQEYSLGGTTSFYKLTDVSYVSINCQIASGTDATKETAKIIELKIGMQHPKYPETGLQQIMHAKLDFTVTLESKNIGGI